MILRVVSTTPSFIHTVAESNLKDELSKLGLQFDSTAHRIDSLAGGDIVALVAGDHVVTKHDMDRMPNLRTIARFGKGYDSIDLVAAQDRNIVVSNVTKGNHEAVAEFTLSLVFALLRNICGYDRDIKMGIWNRSRSMEVRGKTLGIIGCGLIGSRVASLAEGVGMNVLGASHDPCSHHEDARITMVPLDQLLQSSDVITLHVPLTDATRNFVDARFLQQMKSGAFIVNTSRGEVINEMALLEALMSGTVAGAGLDVFSVEPPFQNDISMRLAQHPRVISSPHVASFTPEAQYCVAKRVIDNIAAVMKGSLSDADIVRK